MTLLPEPMQEKILKSVREGSTENQLTPAMMLTHLNAVYDHAMTMHWEIPAGGKDADGAWTKGPDPLAVAGLEVVRQRQRSCA